MSAAWALSSRSNTSTSETKRGANPRFARPPSSRREAGNGVLSGNTVHQLTEV
jgi:hypothetical protein